MHPDGSGFDVLCDLRKRRSKVQIFTNVGPTHIARQLRSVAPGRIAVVPKGVVMSKEQKNEFAPGSLEGARSATGAAGRWSFAAILPKLIRLLTWTLICILCLWMGVGTIKMGLALKEVLEQSWTLTIEHVIINSLIMLALLEVIRTLQAYLTLGYVRVVFILDTALVVLIGELMGLWFREYMPMKVLLSLGVIAALTFLRILFSRFSRDPESGGSGDTPGEGKGVSNQ
jgi:uncharacterized membrane protein (DUF373 family)